MAGEVDIKKLINFVFVSSSQVVSNFAVVDRTVNSQCIIMTALSYIFTALHCMQRSISDRKSALRVPVCQTREL